MGATRRFRTFPQDGDWNIKFEEMGSVDYTVDLHRMTAPNVSIRS